MAKNIRQKCAFHFFLNAPDDLLNPAVDGGVRDGCSMLLYSLFAIFYSQERPCAHEPIGSVRQHP
jgi:hypothetical protein